MTRERMEPDHVVKPVRHEFINWMCKRGRFLGEVEVTPDQVVWVETMDHRMLCFQSAGTGTVRFYEMRISDERGRDREHVAAHGVPMRFITDFGTPDDKDAELRLERIRGRKAARA